MKENALEIIKRIFNLRTKDGDSYVRQVDDICNQFLAEHHCGVCGDYHDEGCVPLGCQTGDGI